MTNGFGGGGIGSLPSSDVNPASQPDPRQRYPLAQQQQRLDQMPAHQYQEIPPPHNSQQGTASPPNQSQQQPRSAQSLSRGSNMTRALGDNAPISPPSQGSSSVGTRYDRLSGHPSEPVTAHSQRGFKSAWKGKEQDDDENRPPSSYPMSKSILKRPAQTVSSHLPTDQQRQGQEALTRPTAFIPDHQVHDPAHHTWKQPSRPSQSQLISSERSRGRSISGSRWEGGNSRPSGFNDDGPESAALFPQPAPRPLPNHSQPGQVFGYPRSRSVPSDAVRSIQAPEFNLPSPLPRHVQPETPTVASLDSYIEAKLSYILDPVQRIQAEKTLLREELGFSLQKLQLLRDEGVRSDRDLAQARQEVQAIRDRCHTLGTVFRRAFREHETAALAVQSSEEGRRRELDEQLHDLSESRNSLKQAVEEVANKTHGVSVVNTNLHTMVKSLNEEVKEFAIVAERLVQARKEKKAFEGLAESKDKELNEAHIVNASLEVKLEHWETMLGPDLTALKEKITKLDSKSEDLSPGLQTALDINLDLHNKLEAKEKELQEAIRAKETAETSRDVDVEKLEEIEAFIKARGYDVDDLESMIGQMEEKSLKELKEVTGRRDKEIKDLEYRVRALTAQTQLLEKQTGEMDNLRGSKEKQAADHAASLARLQAEVNRLQHDNVRIGEEHAERERTTRDKVHELSTQLAEMTSKCQRLETVAHEKDRTIVKLETKTHNMERQLATNEARFDGLQKQLEALVQHPAGLSSSTDENVIQRLKEELRSCQQELEQKKQADEDRKDTSLLDRHLNDGSTSEEMELVHYIESIAKSKHESEVEDLRARIHELQTKVKATSGRPAHATASLSLSKPTSETGEEEEPSGPPHFTLWGSVNAPYKSPLLGKAAQNAKSGQRNLPKTPAHAPALAAVEAMEVYGVDLDDDPQYDADCVAASDSVSATAANAAKRKSHDGGKASEKNDINAKRRKGGDDTNATASDIPAKTDRVTRSNSNQDPQHHFPASQNSKRDRDTAVKPLNSSQRGSKKRSIDNKDDEDFIPGTGGMKKSGGKR